MLNKKLLKHLLASGINIIVLSLLTSFMAFLQFLIFGKSHGGGFDFRDVFGAGMLMVTLIYLLYGLLLMIVNNDKVTTYMKAWICALVAPIEIYFLVISFGGSGDLHDIKFVVGLFIIMIVGFIIPYLHAFFLKILN